MAREPTEPHAGSDEALILQVERAEAGDQEAARALFGALVDWSEVAPALRFRLELGQLWYVLEHRADFPDDLARELYSELLDRHAATPPQLAELHAAGARLHQLEHDGELPRAMVVRSRRQH